MVKSILGLEVDLCVSESYISWAKNYLDKSSKKFDSYVITENGDVFSMLRTVNDEYYDFNANVYTALRCTKVEGYMIASIINTKLRTEKYRARATVVSLSSVAEAYVRYWCHYRV